MADVRDILGVAGKGPATGDEAKPKAKEARVRPKGMSREAFALLDGSHPLGTTHLAEGLLKKQKDKQQKARPNLKVQVVWRHKPFHNKARTDGLELVHWEKVRTAPSSPPHRTPCSWSRLGGVQGAAVASTSCHTHHGLTQLEQGWAAADVAGRHVRQPSRPLVAPLHQMGAVLPCPRRATRMPPAASGTSTKARTTPSTSTTRR